MGKSKANGRMANLELLRMVSMMLVVVLHFLGKGGSLGVLSAPDMKRYEYLAWFLEAFAIVAVNAYMLLSGFFLVESSFKLKRLLSLLLQVWFYSIGVGLVAAAFGYLPEGGFTIHYLLMLVFPISMEHYWFMTAYVFLYLFIPFLTAGIRKLTKKQLQMTMILLLICFSGMKSVLHVVLETDRLGYDCIWYVCVFVVAAYIRLYGLPFFKNKRRSIAVYLGAAAGIFALTMGFRMIYLKTGSLELVLSKAYEYNHLLVLAASVGLFYLFFHMKIKSAKAAAFICKISPYTLGVYLLHEHVAIRYEWPQWLYSVFGEPTDCFSLLYLLILAVVIVFVAGIVVDMLRTKLFAGMNWLLMHLSVYRKMLLKIDTMTGPEKDGKEVL